MKMNDQIKDDQLNNVTKHSENDSISIIYHNYKIIVDLSYLPYELKKSDIGVLGGGEER